jgi:hypothetical protein
MTTSLKQTSLFTEDKSTSSQVDFPVNRTVKLESDLERKMTATSGQKCLESFARFSRVGLWVKTYSGLLIGMTDWYSTKCKLTWKLKGTKSSRMYFQLWPSTLPIDVTGFGLLPTPKAWDGDGGGARPVVNGKTTFSSPGVKDLCHAGLLPTPVASDATTGAIMGKNDTFRETSGLPRKVNQNGTDGSVGLARLVKLLPTPTAMDSTNATATMKSTQVKEGSMHSVTLSGAILSKEQQETGRTSQLNPRFVAEMMGYPPNYTELPFLNGELSP